MRFPIAIILCLFTSAALAADAPDPGADQLERGFRETVHPFVKSYCFECHSGTKPKGDVDLSSYSSAEAAAKDYRRWELMAERLDAKEMPPDEAKRHPAPAESRLVIDWIQSVRRFEAKKNAGDPGPVFARRLSNAEYDYTIRDLIGVDLRPAQHFPVDPANEAGFDNSSESLTMTPSLVKKYLEAARLVSDHLVFTTDGLEFAPHPVVADTDCDKYCVNRIIDFYQRQCTDYAKYFEAAWRFKNRAALRRSQATLNDTAAEAGVSAEISRDDLVGAHRPGRGRRPDRGIASDVARVARRRTRSNCRGEPWLREDAQTSCRAFVPSLSRMSTISPMRALAVARSPRCCGKTGSSPPIG